MKPNAPIQRAATPASNFARALAENEGMKALLRAREQTESDDDDEQADHYRPRAVLRMRCYACAGSGKLELTFEGEKKGRLVRCIACDGSGKVAVE
jgi:hypothetical protein